MGGNFMRMLYIASARIPTETAHGYQIVKMYGAFADARKDVLCDKGHGKIHLKEDLASFLKLSKSIRIWSSFYILSKGKIKFRESP
jgi:hypothetical protein